MSKILVQNNLDGMVQIQLPATSPGAKGLGPVLTLVPGNTIVDKTQWDIAKKNPTVQKMLAERIQSSAAPELNPQNIGRVKLIEQAELPDENPLKDMKPVIAQKVIEETLDTNLLKIWLPQETRGDVRKAIEAQIKAIDSPPDIAVARGER